MSFDRTEWTIARHLAPHLRGRVYIRSDLFGDLARTGAKPELITMVIDHWRTMHFLDATPDGEELILSEDGRAHLSTLSNAPNASFG